MYKKPQSVKNFEKEYQDAYMANRTCPYPLQFKYRDDTANGLTKLIIDFLRLRGWQAERINSTGRMIDHRKQVKDCMGRTHTIGSAQWIPSSGQVGTADISATIQGKSVKIEVKIGADRQRHEQRMYQSDVENAGGIYFITKSFDDFLQSYECIIFGNCSQNKKS